MAEKPKYREMGRLERADVEGTTAAQRKAMRKASEAKARQAVAKEKVKASPRLFVDFKEEPQFTTWQRRAATAPNTRNGLLKLYNTWKPKTSEGKVYNAELKKFIDSLEDQGSERPFVDFSEKPLRQTIKRTKAVRDKK